MPACVVPRLRVGRKDGLFLRIAVDVILVDDVLRLEHDVFLVGVGSAVTFCGRVGHSGGILRLRGVVLLGVGYLVFLRRGILL